MLNRLYSTLKDGEDDATVRLKNAFPDRKEEEVVTALKEAGDNAILAAYNLLNSTPVPDIRATPEKWFEHFDRDNSKTLDQSEVLEAMCLTWRDLDRSIVKIVVDSLWPTFDKDGNGQVSLEEFVAPEGLRQAILDTLDPLEGEKDEDVDDEHAGFKSLTDAIKHFQLSDDGVMAVYFTANMLEPFDRCRALLESRQEVYTKNRHKFEVLVCSQDVTQESYLKTCADLPAQWEKIPWQSKIAREQLPLKLQVDAVPSIVLVDCHGKVITTKGRVVLAGDTDGSKFPWKYAEGKLPGFKDNFDVICDAEMSSLKEMFGDDRKDHRHTGEGHHSHLVRQFKRTEVAVSDTAAEQEADKVELTIEGYNKIASFSSNAVTKRFAARICRVLRLEVKDKKAFGQVIWKHASGNKDSGLPELVSDLMECCTNVSAAAGRVSLAGIAGVALTAAHMEHKRRIEEELARRFREGDWSEQHAIWDPEGKWSPEDWAKWEEEIAQEGTWTAEEWCQWFGVDPSSGWTAEEWEAWFKNPPAEGAEDGGDGASGGYPSGKGAPPKGKGKDSKGGLKGSGPGKDAKGTGKGPKGPGKGKDKGKGKVDKTPWRPEKEDWVKRETNRLRWNRLVRINPEWDSQLQDRSVFHEGKINNGEDEINLESLATSFVQDPADHAAAVAMGFKAPEKPLLWEARDIKMSASETRHQAPDHVKQMMATLSCRFQPENTDKLCGALEGLRFQDLHMDEIFRDRFGMLVLRLGEITDQDRERLLEEGAEDKYDWSQRIEGFYRKFVGIKEINQRVAALHGHLTIEADCKWVGDRLARVQESMTAVSNCAALGTVARKVLTIGNYLNAGNNEINRADGYDVVMIANKLLAKEPRGKPSSNTNLLKHLAEAQLDDNLREELGTLATVMKSWQGQEDMADLAKMEFEIKTLEKVHKKLAGMLDKAQKAAKARHQDDARADESREKAKDKLSLMQLMKGMLQHHQTNIQQLEETMESIKTQWEELKVRFSHMQTKKSAEADQPKAGPMLFAFSSLAKALGTVKKAA